jgi:hypothetical protein
MSDLGQDFACQATLLDGASTPESWQSGNGGRTRQVFTRFCSDRCSVDVRGKCAMALNRCRDSRCAGCPMEGSEAG